MDIVSLWTWRGVYDRPMLAIMLPGAMIGIGIGWLTAALVTADMVRLIVGAVAHRLRRRAGSISAVRHGAEPCDAAEPVLAAFWGTVSGFTSFVAHVGGPPFQVYALPLQARPESLHRHRAIFFAVTNAVKLVPYFALGQFDATNLTASAGADAARAAGDARRRLAGEAHAAGGLLSLHLRHGRADRGEADL